MKLKGWKHGLKCTRCCAKRPAKYVINGDNYCKRCYKRLQKRLKIESLPRWRQNERTVTGRILKLRRRETPAELCFRLKLKDTRIKFKFQRGFIKGGYYAIVDFHIPSRNICIEIDGGYHNSPEQQAKDKRRDKWLEEVRGQKVYRLTNQQAFDITIDEIRQLIS